MKVLCEEFSGEELVAKIERFIDEHKKAGKEVFVIGREISEGPDGQARYEITVKAPLRGEVNCFAHVRDGNFTDAADRAYYKALLLLGY
jgi:hypothetical protein